VTFRNIIIDHGEDFGHNYLKIHILPHSGFSGSVNDIWTVLKCYTVHNISLLPTFQENLSVTSARSKCN
jgi:hypothetical protein